MVFLRQLCQHCSLLNVVVRNVQTKRIPHLLFSRPLTHVVLISETSYFNRGLLQNRSLLQNTLVPNEMLKRGKKSASKGGSKTKGKSKKGGGGGGKVDYSLGGDVIDLHAVEEDMAKIISQLEDLYRNKYSGKLTAHTLDNVGVQVDGGRHRVNQIADVAADGKEFLIRCTSKEHAKAVGQAIIRSLNIVITYEDDSCSVRVPALLSTEYRHDLIRPIKDAMQGANAQIRSVFQASTKVLKKSDETEDLIYQIEEQLKLLFTKYQENSKTIHDKKVAEIMKS